MVLSVRLRRNVARLHCQRRLSSQVRDHGPTGAGAACSARDSLTDMTDAFPKFQKAPVRWREQTERWREQTETIDAEIARLLSRPWTSADEIEDRRQRFAELR